MRQPALSRLPTGPREPSNRPLERQSFPLRYMHRHGETQGDKTGLLSGIPDSRGDREVQAETLGCGQIAVNTWVVKYTLGPKIVAAVGVLLKQD